MQNKRMSAVEFNYLVQNAGHDNSLMEILYAYCAPIIKEHVHYRFGNNNFYDEVPHDVITRITIDYKPKKFITHPVAYICRATQNHLNNMTALKDNQTLELFENYPYSPNFERNIIFENEVYERVWFMLDYKSRYIFYLDELLGYKLKEIALLLSLNYDYVRTIKSRAKKFLAENLNKEKFKKAEVNV